MIGSEEDRLSKFGQELERTDGYFKYGSLAVQSGMNDDSLLFCYQKFREDDLIQVVFHEWPDINVYEFLTVFRDPSANTLGAFRENPETFRWDLEGLLWTTGYSNKGRFNRYTVGMGFFRGITDLDRLLGYAQLGVSWCFDRLKADVLYGNTPAKNRAALIFGRRLGFQQTNPLEAGCIYDGELSSTVYSSLTKEKWQQVRPWKE